MVVAVAVGEKRHDFAANLRIPMFDMDNTLYKRRFSGMQLTS